MELTHRSPILIRCGRKGSLEPGVAGQHQNVRCEAINVRMRDYLFRAELRSAVEKLCAGDRKGNDIAQLRWLAKCTSELSFKLPVEEAGHTHTYREGGREGGGRREMNRHDAWQATQTKQHHSFPPRQTKLPRQLSWLRYHTH